MFLYAKYNFERFHWFKKGMFFQSPINDKRTKCIVSQSELNVKKESDKICFGAPNYF